LWCSATKDNAGNSRANRQVGGDTSFDTDFDTDTNTEASRHATHIDYDTNGAIDQNGRGHGHTSASQRQL
jgi:hypothetical protein